MDRWPPPPWTTELQWSGTAIKAGTQTVAQVRTRANVLAELSAAWLIAAAPSLLAALEEIVRAHRAGQVLDPDGPLVHAAMSAIAAARGLEDS
jgi:hypothetical protein